MKKFLLVFQTLLFVLIYNGVNAQYCLPTYTTGCSSSDGLTYFALNTITQTIPCSGTPAWYHDYTALSTDIAQNNDYTISVKSAYANTYVNVWIDYNHNFTFDSPGELVGQIFCSVAGTIYTSNLTVSGTSLTGTTRLRAMTNYSSGYPTLPCGSYTYGNCQDFTVNIFVPVALAPVAVTNNATLVSTVSTSLNATINPNFSSSTVTFEFGTTTSYGTIVSGTPNNLIGGASQTSSYVMSGLVFGQTYHYRVHAVNAIGESYGSDMTFTQYCVPTFSTGCSTGYGLVNVQLGTINQAIPCTGTPSYYHDYAALSTDLIPNNNSVITINAPQYAAVTAWIDYNHDNVFDPVTEKVGYTYCYGYGYTINFTVPITAMTGPARLRILAHDNVLGYPTDPCGSSEIKGNCEDFTVNILPPGAPFVTTQAATYVGATLATLNGSVNPDNLSTTVSIDWGTDNTYGQSVSASPSTLTGGTYQSVTGSLP
ncbi:MAG: GEVED domain-containing protein, partial [Bacteroidota bacterium]